jgi:CHAD domain-containing protein
LRIRAKRARYAAEAAGLLLPEAAEHGRALAVVTDVLGEYHDTAVGEAWVRSAVARGVTREQALAAGLMIAGLRRQGDDAVSRWGEAWSRAERRKVRRWLDR